MWYLELYILTVENKISNQKDSKPYNKSLEEYKTIVFYVFNSICFWCLDLTFWTWRVHLNNSCREWFHLYNFPCLFFFSLIRLMSLNITLVSWFIFESFISHQAYYPEAFIPVKVCTFICTDYISHYMNHFFHFKSWIMYLYSDMNFCVSIYGVFFIFVLPTCVFWHVYYL